MTIEIDIIINRSKDEIFNYWIDQEKIKEWLARDNSETVVNPRKNGKFWIYIDENHNTKGCDFIAVKKNEEIEFTWKGPLEFDDFLNFPGELTTVKVIISTVEDTSTNVTLQHFGWKSSEDYQNARKWHQEFWNQKLNTLKIRAEILRSD
jgi:uncharacterized protein YndB with AHSA1/START domain